jgi:hypothetical protein
MIQLDVKNCKVTTKWRGKERKQIHQGWEDLEADVKEDSNQISNLPLHSLNYKIL